MALPADLGYVFPFKEKVPSFRDIGTVRPSDLGLQPAFGKWRQPSSGALVAVSGLGGGRCRAVLPDYTAFRGELRRASCGRCRGGGPCIGVVGQGRHQPASCCLFPLLLLNQTQVAGWVPWAFPHLRRCEPSRGLRLSKPVRLAGKVCASQKVGTRDHPNGREL